MTVAMFFLIICTKLESKHFFAVTGPKGSLHAIQSPPSCQSYVFSV